MFNKKTCLGKTVNIHDSGVFVIRLKLELAKMCYMTALSQLINVRLLQRNIFAKEYSPLQCKKMSSHELLP